MSSTTVKNQSKRPATSFTVDFLLSKSTSGSTVIDDHATSQQLNPKPVRSEDDCISPPTTATTASIESKFGVRHFAGLNTWLPIAYSADSPLKPRLPAFCFTTSGLDSLERPCPNIEEFRPCVNTSYHRDFNNNSAISSIFLNAKERIHTGRDSSHRYSMPFFSRMPASVRPSSGRPDVNGNTSSHSTGVHNWPFQQRKADIKLSNDSPDGSTFLWSPHNISDSNRCTDACSRWCFHQLPYRSTFASTFNPKRKRFRTAFTSAQMNRLESSFRRNRYAIGSERRTLSRDLGLTETQIKVWFQNRRTKYRKIRELCNSRQLIPSPHHFRDVLATSSPTYLHSNTFYENNVARECDVTHRPNVAGSPPVVGSSVDDSTIQSAGGFTRI